MKPTYVDVLCARAEMAETLSEMWWFVAKGELNLAMWAHFEYLCARDNHREMAKHLDFMEANRLTDAYLIADGLAEEFRM